LILWNSLRRSLFEAAVAESQAMDGRSDDPEHSIIPASTWQVGQRSGTIA
jgi:hypothetical protein